MIEVTSVTKHFGKIRAVSNLTFTAHSGDIIGFLGLNGAGKTTTMRLLLGYTRSDQGTIRIHNFSPQSNRQDILRLTGYLPENNPLYTDMKVSEYLSFIAALKKASADERAVVPEQVGIADKLSARIDTLSRGYKQRVGLAAALLGNPRVLILDEPTSGLDPLEQDRIRSLITQIAPGKTILFSSHILSEVEAIATRLIIIDQGAIVYDGTVPKGKGAVEKLFKKVVSAAEFIK